MNQTWICLLRGINVGGKNIVAMADLRDLLRGLGFEDVRSYIQSGNVVLRSRHDKAHIISSMITKAMAERFGFAPRIMVMAADDFKAAIDAVPYPQAKAEPKCVHLYFLGGVPEDFDGDALTEAASETEQFELGERAFYLYAPDGIGRSKLAGSAERILNVPVTARNYRTAVKVLALSAPRKNNPESI